MELLDYIEVSSGLATHRIELFHGDLTDMPPEHAVDVLVVSAYPDNYVPVRFSLIGALSKIGVDVKALSHEKDADLRESFSCWMSKELVSTSPQVQFKRILVFEPFIRGKPADVVGDIFQSLMPFVYTTPHVKSIAMPLVATGRQGIAPDKILAPLLEAAVNWLALGLPVEVIKIVEYSKAKALAIKDAFAELKQQYSTPTETAHKLSGDFSYDFFISYSHDDFQQVDYLYNALVSLNPDARIFMDRRNLTVGAAWQQELYETIDDCRQVITVYSPTYLSSKVCKEEYNIALMRHREEGDVLVPIYLESAKLPTYMRLIQFIDCRESDHEKLQNACTAILRRN
ncbi:MAG: toll/interleukin-1 receptor domain-containing protein [Aggregatilineales bacterium]